jgi:Protein of unknown function (DUF1579)
MSVPSNELRRLDPLVGRWRTKAHTEDGVWGPVVPITSEEEFYWLEGGYFLVQTYRTTFGDEPVQAGINYWFYDDETGQFRIIFFSNNGPFTEDGNRYAGGVTTGTLTMTGPARFQYQLDSSGKIKTGADGTITIDWWLADDNGQFQPWMTNVFERRKCSLSVRTMSEPT